MCFYAYFDSFFIYSVICWLFRSTLFSLHMFLFLIVFFSLKLTSDLNSLWSEKMVEMISILMNLPRLDSWPRMWSILENVPCALEKTLKFVVLAWNVLLISIRSNWSIVSNQSILKEISPEISLEGMMLKLKLQYSCEELTHWKRLWCWEGLEAGGKGDDRGWDGWMTSLTRWTWVWVNSGSWWWTGRPGVLRFMGSQRVGHDWVTDLIWSDYTIQDNKNVTYLNTGKGSMDCSR